MASAEEAYAYMQYKKKTARTKSSPSTQDLTLQSQSSWKPKLTNREIGQLRQYQQFYHHSYKQFTENEVVKIQMNRIMRAINI